MIVDIWSDVVCPWCAIGMSRFEKALEATGVQATIRLHPFQLDPEAPVPGVPARERYLAKFGEAAPAMLERVTNEAAEEGLAFDFGRALSANTFDAHRAIAYARASGKDRDFEKRLFRAYFGEGLDVSDLAVLADLGAELGLDRAPLAAYLESDRGVDELRGELVAAFDRGINAVPSFVFQDEFVVPGAVDVSTFGRILEQMRGLAAQDHP
jgi:predicted DsbA family dithiol-disulfide isomerase